MNKRNKTTYVLSGFQVIALTASSYFPLTFFIFPRVAASFAGIDAPWATGGCIVVMLYIALIHGALNERFPATSGPDMVCYAYGKWLGKLIGFSFLGVYVLFVAMSVNAFVQMIHMIFWPNTPVFALTLVLALVSLLGASYGLETLARVATIVFPITWLGTLSMFILSAVQGHWYGVPLQIASVRATMSGVYHLLPVALGFNIVLLLSPYYQHEKRRTLFYPLISMLAGCMLLFGGLFAGFVTFRWVAVQHVSYPIPLMFQLARLPGWIVEKTGLFTLVFSTFFLVLFVSAHLWGLSTLLARIYERPDTSYRRMLLLVPVFITAIAIALSRDAFTELMIDKYLVPAAWFTLVIEPTLKYILAVLRGKKSPRIAPRRQVTQGES